MGGWVIYYGDGSTFSEADGPAEHAPGRNVQVILQPHPRTNVIPLHGADYYVRRNGEWIGLDWQGVVDFFVECGLLKVGQTLSVAEWQAVLAQALEEYDKRKANG